MSEESKEKPQASKATFHHASTLCLGTVGSTYSDASFASTLPVLALRTQTWYAADASCHLVTCRGTCLKPTYFPQLLLACLEGG